MIGALESMGGLVVLEARAAPRVLTVSGSREYLLHGGVEARDMGLSSG